MKHVLPSMSLAKASCTNFSVRVSMLLVASSKMSMGGRQIMTRATHRSCFCPSESDPSPPMIVSYPLGRRLMKPCACTAFAAAIISSSVQSGLPMHRFSRTVARLSHVSCSTMP